MRRHFRLLVRRDDRASFASILSTFLASLVRFVEICCSFASRDIELLDRDEVGDVLEYFMDEKSREVLRSIRCILSFACWDAAETKLLFRPILPYDSCILE